MALTRGHSKLLRTLGVKKGRHEHGLFFIEGSRMIREALASDASIVEIFVTDEFRNEPGKADLPEAARRKNVPVHRVSPRELEKMAGTVQAQGIVALVRPRKHSLDSVLDSAGGESVLVALDAVADPGNLGSIIRTCDWFGVSGVVLGERSVELANPKVLRGTMGSVFHLPVVEGVDLLAALSQIRARGYTVYVTDPGGETHFDRMHFSQKSCIVFGNEAWGASDQIKELADVRLAIRRYGAAESLNVGVACGIVLSALHRFVGE
jgi:TrmH family RNA methyltransferase